MSLETSFNHSLDAWIMHCNNPRVQLSSSPSRVKECDAYRTLVSLGYDALPFILETYKKDDTDDFRFSLVKAHGLVALVHDIVGDDFKIPRSIQGQVVLMEQYTKNWLEDNAQHYT